MTRTTERKNHQTKQISCTESETKHKKKTVKNFHNICSTHQKHFIVRCLFIKDKVDIGASGTQLICDQLIQNKISAGRRKNKIITTH